nr:uncharacterized protein LOC124808245 [Hydra vulgaris]
MFNESLRGRKPINFYLRPNLKRLLFDQIWKMLFIAIFFTFCLAFVYGGDGVLHVQKQSVCTEVSSPPTKDCRWHANLDVYADSIILGGCTVVAFKLQWFSGAWSDWFVKGVNDIDVKVNINPIPACSTPVLKNTMRRWWSYFYDHNHKYIKCCRAPK